MWLLAPRPGQLLKLLFSPWIGILFNNSGKTSCLVGVLMLDFLMICDKRSMIGAGSVCACFHNSNFANEKVSPYICKRRELTSILFYPYTNYSIWCLIAIIVWPFCFFFPILCQDRPKTIKPAQADEVHAYMYVWVINFCFCLVEFSATKTV